MSYIKKKKELSPERNTVLIQISVLNMIQRLIISICLVSHTFSETRKLSRLMTAEKLDMSIYFGVARHLRHIICITELPKFTPIGTTYFIEEQYICICVFGDNFQDCNITFIDVTCKFYICGAFLFAWYPVKTAKLLP